MHQIINYRILNKNYTIKITFFFSVMESFVFFHVHELFVFCLKGQKQRMTDWPQTVNLSITTNDKVFHGHQPPSGESTTTECGVNYQLLAVKY